MGDKGSGGEDRKLKGKGVKRKTRLLQLIFMAGYSTAVPDKLCISHQSPPRKSFRLAPH